MSHRLTHAEYTCVDFLRHGECQGGEIFRGSGTDVELSDNGRQQMRDSVQGITSWDSIISSPMQRCRRFAVEQSERLAIPMVENSSWREIYFGDWEGRIIADVWREAPDLVANYFKDPYSDTPHNGEAVSVVAERLQTAWDALLNEHRNQHVLVVQHGGTMRILLALILGMPATAMNHFEVPFACLTRLKVFHRPGHSNYPLLVSHNTGLDLQQHGDKRESN